jgi:hypothetical protein
MFQVFRGVFMLARCAGETSAAFKRKRGGVKIDSRSAQLARGALGGRK